ncbi:hypothetical protein ACQKMD_07605 [Viridibacillus sp. NPDC096237]|uniref:hypothetical protein n=1 Tax=Viridibacillus sp. NPDC096237 TaxID=3390721 RepID=UPI003CFC133A
MNKRIRAIIGTTCSLVLCIFGIYSLITASSSVIPAVLFAIGGFIGFIGGIYDLKNLDIA